MRTVFAVEPCHWPTYWVALFSEVSGSVSLAKVEHFFANPLKYGTPWNWVPPTPDHVRFSNENTTTFWCSFGEPGFPHGEDEVGTVVVVVLVEVGDVTVVEVEDDMVVLVEDEEVVVVEGDVVGDVLVVDDEPPVVVVDPEEPLRTLCRMSRYRPCPDALAHCDALSMAEASPHSSKVVVSCHGAFDATMLCTFAVNRAGSRARRGVASPFFQNPGEML